MENSVFDRIFLKDFRKSLEIGAFQEERQILQEISISITLEVRGQAPSDDEAVDDILSYDVLVNAVERNLAQHRYNLLEALAEDIADDLLRHDKAVAVDIEIQKLGRVDGVLGCAIRREGKRASLANAAPTHRLWIVKSDAVHEPRGDSPAIYVPMLEFAPISDPIEQHILASRLDQKAWELAKVLGLPVVDTQTETEALAARGASFIRAFGKPIFATQPPLEIWDENALVDWAIHALNPISHEWI